MTRSDDQVAWATMCDGSRMLLDLRVNMEAWAYWTGWHDREAITQLRARLPTGGIALDVGANVGLYTVPLALKAASAGRVLAFEPLPVNFARLQENIVANQLGHIVTSLRCAVGATDGTLAIEPADGRGLTGNASRAQPGSAQVVSAPLRPLDDVARELGLDRCHAVKVDIEGGEFDFLVGGEGFLREHLPVIYLEVNGPHMRAFGWSERELLDLAAKWGYRAVVRRNKRFVHFVELSTTIENIDLIRA